MCSGTSKPFQIQDVFRVESDNGAEELPTLIDKKVDVLSVLLSLFQNQHKLFTGDVFAHGVCKA